MMRRLSVSLGECPCGDCEVCVCREETLYAGQNEDSPIDPVCAIHGKRWSEHDGGRCLYCCLCFRPLTLAECHILSDGSPEDVCVPCAEDEAAQLASRWRSGF